MNTKRFINKLMVACCALAIGLVLSGQAQAADTFVKIATGNVGGVYYPVGVGMGQLIQKNNPGFIASGMATAGSVENITLLQTGEAHIAMIQSNVVEDAVNGERPFKQKYTNLRGITALWPNIQHLVVTKDIKTFGDLKGKRFVVGAARGGTEVITYALMDAAGLDYRNKDKSKNDFTPVWIAYSEAVESMNNKQTSGGLFQAFPPGSAIAELMTEGSYHILPMSSDYLDKLLEKYPYFARFTLPAGTYTNQPDPVSVSACPVLLITLESMPEDVVYALTKTIFEQLPELYNIHQATKMISMEKARDGMSIPLHKGAERYLREKGMLQ